VIRTFNSAAWTAVVADSQFKKMTFRIPAVSASQYIRLRGTNLPPSVPFETDADGNPLPDLWTNASAVRYADTTNPPGGSSQPPEFPENYFLRIPCEAAGTTEFDGCPSHLPTVTIPASGDTPEYTGKASAYDVAAWADLWFYSNPIYIEVGGSTLIAGVR
jgi:hypothetical protein